MPIPDWIHKWIEQLDDPAQDVIMLSTDEDRLHASWCAFRAGEECTCQRPYSELNPDGSFIITDDTQIVPPDDWA